jgi:hypothetical protein
MAFLKYSGGAITSCGGLRDTEHELLALGAATYCVNFIQRIPDIIGHKTGDFI